MTDLSHDHLDDEAISAVLDGAGTEAESRHVAGCEACSARLSALRAVASAVAAPVPPIDAGRLDDAIAAALSAQNVVPISVARAARRPPAWLGAAAGVAAVLGVAGLLAGGTGGSSDDSGDETAASAGASADDAESSIALEESGEDMATMSDEALTSPSPAGGAIGSGAGLGELRDADLRALVEGAQAQRETDAPPTTTTPADGGAGGAAAPCEAELRAAEPSLGAVLFTADGTWEGQPAAVVVFDHGPDERLAYVVLYEGCGVMRAESWV